MARRKKKKSLSQFTHKSILAAEKGHYGDEPDFTDSISAGCKRIKALDSDGKPDPELAYLKALNWYNACGKDSQYSKWLTEYAKTVLNIESKELGALKKLSKIDRTLAINARIICRGADSTIVPSSKQTILRNEVVRLIAASTVKEQKAATTQQDETKTDAPKKPSVQEYMQQAADAFFADVVIPIIDDLFATGGKQNKDHDMYALLNKHDIKGRVALKVIDLVQPTIDELNKSIDKTDDQLVEGYSFLTPAKRRKVRDKLVEFVDDCNKLNSMAKKTRKTTKRKKKTPSAAKLLAGFKYKEKDDEYKIASVDPKKIIGASSAVLFNTKTRRATWICAVDRTGLNIKGASIIGYDEKTSVQKIIRKPSEFLSATNGKGKRAIKNAFDGINAKNGFRNGKVNAHTIILTVVK